MSVYNRDSKKWQTVFPSLVQSCFFLYLGNEKATSSPCLQLLHYDTNLQDKCHNFYGCVFTTFFWVTRPDSTWVKSKSYFGHFNRTNSHTLFFHGAFKYYARHNICVASGQSIADLYNEHQDPFDKVLDDDMCRSAMYLYSKLKLEADNELLTLAYPACPEASANDEKDRLLLTMDGNFSQKCKKDPTIYDEDNHIPLIDGMWVKKEEFAGVEDAAPSREALERENNFKAAGTGKRKHNQYPVTGLFACVCPRHEIVRKLADMDSSEGFKYPTAILRTLLSGANRPHHKVMAMYDVACLYEKTYSGVLTDLGYTGGDVGCANIPCLRPHWALPSFAEPPQLRRVRAH